MSKDVTLDWPGVFADWFDGGSIAAGQTSNDDEAWLYYAYRNAEELRRGRGYTLRLALPAEHAEEILAIVLAHVEAWEQAQKQTGKPVPRRTRITIRQYLARTRAALDHPFP